MALSKLSASLREKLQFYEKAGTLKKVSFKGGETERILDFIKKTSADKVKNISEVARTNIKQVLLVAQSNQIPFIETVNRIAGSGIDKGIWGSIQQRAAKITSHELRRSRNAGLFAYAVDQGYNKFTWISVLMKTTCTICRKRHGKTKSYKVWLRLGIPPSPHPFCKCSLIPGENLNMPKRPIELTALRKAGIKSGTLMKMKQDEYDELMEQFEGLISEII